MSSSASPGGICARKAAAPGRVWIRCSSRWEGNRGGPDAEIVGDNAARPDQAVEDSGTDYYQYRDAGAVPADFRQFAARSTQISAAGDREPGQRLLWAARDGA